MFNLYQIFMLIISCNIHILTVKKKHLHLHTLAERDILIHHVNDYKK